MPCRRQPRGISWRTWRSLSCSLLFGCNVLLCLLAARYSSLRKVAVDRTAHRSLSELQAQTHEATTALQHMQVKQRVAGERLLEKNIADSDEIAVALPCHLAEFRATARRVIDEGPSAPMSSDFNQTFKHRNFPRQLSLKACKCMCSGE